MIQIGAFEAKTHFSQLLSKVMKGETVNITRHGKKVAMLVPVSTDSEIIQQDPVEEAIEGILELQKHTKLGSGLSIKEMIEKGRR